MALPTLDPVPPSYDYRPPMEPYLSVVHVDDDILVLDKPSGLLSVPGKDPALADCLAARAAEEYPGARIVHRLDKDTSGVMVLGLSKRAISGLGIQFEKRHTKKAYVARVWGDIAEDSGRVDLPLATDWENKPRQRVDFEHGRPAQTDWTVLDREGGITRGEARAPHRADASAQGAHAGDRPPDPGRCLLRHGAPRFRPRGACNCTPRS